MADMRIKLIKTPYLLESWEKLYSFTIGSIYLPPIDMGIITGFLRNRGYCIDQDDLNIKMHRNPGFKAEQTRRIFLKSTDRIIAYIKDGNDREIDSWLDRLFALTDTNGYDFFLLSAFDYCQGLSAVVFNLVFAKYLKKRFPTSCVICGGGRLERFITREFYSFLKRNKCLDFVFLGAGELALDIFFKELNNKKCFNNVPGLVYEDESGVVRVNDRIRDINIKHIDYDGLPMQDYRMRVFDNYFFKRDFEDVLLLPYRFSNGCPHKCAYCFAYRSDNVYVKSVNEIVDDLCLYIEKYKSNYFFLLDDTLNFRKNFIKDLADEIKRRKLKIYFSASVASCNLTEDDLVRLYSIGCRALVFGFETASERLLRLFNKPVNLKSFSFLIKKAHSLGIWTTVNIISGLPTEKNIDICATETFLETHKHVIDDLQCCPFRLIDNTPIAQNPQKYGIENIKIVQKVINDKLFDTGTYFDDRTVNRSFDEINGLKWEDKLKQQEESMRRIRNKIYVLGVPLCERMHVLLRYYVKFIDKTVVRRKYRNLAFLAMIKLYIKYPNVLLGSFEDFLNGNFWFRIKEIFNKLCFYIQEIPKNFKKSQI
jgi:radical SAM superfamily enzyme YgiQ (UPF0313 family)